MGDMGQKLILRKERKSDHDTVERITYRAFLGADHADGTEALLARKLRSHPAFVPQLDFVAELDGRVVGNIMYSKSHVEGKDGKAWETLAFGPVSVLPVYQRQGIGSALISQTLVAAEKMGFRAVLIFGHEDYYPRFGFRPASEYGITTQNGENFPAFMALPLYDNALSGVNGRYIHADLFDNLDQAEAETLSEKLADPMDIDEYIALQQAEIQTLLENIRKTIRSAAPEAIEKISWQMPTFWQGENLIHFAAFKKHISVFPGGEATNAFANRLTEYAVSKGTIRFPLEKPIDYGLIADIVAWRVRQAEEKD